MGMYDYLSCKYPLSVEDAATLEFQTKDTPSQLLEHYEIRSDGTLWHEDYDIEDQSDPDAPGMLRFAGLGEQEQAALRSGLKRIHRNLSVAPGKSTQ